MKMADVLHTIADLLDKVEDDKPAQAPVIVNVNSGSSSNTPTDSHGDDGSDSTKHEHPVMVPPLQQKLEIMKKLAGMPNRAEQFTATVADEDEPFEG